MRTNKKFKTSSKLEKDLSDFFSARRIVPKPQTEKKPDDPGSLLKKRGILKS